MIIHVVQPGDTIYSIAEKYGVPAARLIQDNGLTMPEHLVIGQTIVVLFPEKTYVVQEGDTLLSIADNHNISLMQLLRNNSFLSDREYIYTGETLVISYNNNKRKITTNGYTNPYTNKDVLRKTLPYLTYLSVFGYRTATDGGIVGIDDTEIIQIVKEYGVIPIMLLSTFSGQGIGDVNAVYNILYDEEIRNKHIENILAILREKGYYGVNITFQYINNENLMLYENYARELVDRLNKEGYIVFVTLSANIIYTAKEISFERLNYTQVGDIANEITLLTYNWGYSYGSPLPVTSVAILREFYDYMVTLIPPEKISMGIPLMGYDWEYPYILGLSKASSLTFDAAIDLARDTGSVIFFEETSQAPYFEYIENVGVPINHIVWFTDARSINALVKLVPEYNFVGISIWNIMYFFHQMWLVINSQYEIEKIEL